MNHAIPGVNAGYITRHKLLEDHLRSQQQSISSAVFAALGGLLVEKGWQLAGEHRVAPVSNASEPIFFPEFRQVVASCHGFWLSSECSRKDLDGGIRTQALSWQPELN